jgi:sugar phosphate isomerase/epimerase
LSFLFSGLTKQGQPFDKLRANGDELGSSSSGIRAVEIFENDLLSASQSTKEIGHHMRDLGLECAMFQPFRDFEGLPAHLASA